MDRSQFGSDTAFKAHQAQEHGQTLVAALKPGLKRIARLQYVGETCEVLFEQGRHIVPVVVNADGTYAWRDGGQVRTGTVADGIDPALTAQISELVLST